MSSFNEQVGGDHYKRYPLQPIEVSFAWELRFPEGSVLKYLYRWHVKRNPEDLKKARHFIDMILEQAEVTTAQVQEEPLPAPEYDR